jgi:hypothetical protein
MIERSNAKLKEFRDGFIYVNTDGRYTLLIKESAIRKGASGRYMLVTKESAVRKGASGHPS